MVWIEILVILLLMIANGVFAMSEIAVVSARKARLRQRADEGDAAAAAALELAEAPSDFLSTVQIGITLIGVLAGAFGGATLAEELEAALAEVPVIGPYAEAIGVGLVVLAITYLSLVIGELAPKRYALYNAERLASRIAAPMRALSRLASPLVRLLSFSTQGLLRILGVHPEETPPVTEEEIRIMIEQGARTGVFEPLEEEMVEHVFRLGNRKVSALITPRTEVVWLDLDASPDEIEAKITGSGHSRFPVARGSLDDVLGVVLAKDLLAQTMAGEPLDLEQAVQPAPFVPEGVPALDMLQQLKEARSKIALVLDEYGGLEGLVTTDDILVALVGDIPELGEVSEPEAFRREDGSWLLDGLLPLDEFEEIFGLRDVPAEGTETVGGLVMTLLGRIPSAGDQVTCCGLNFEVMDMDGRRVDKVLVVPEPVEASSDLEAESGPSVKE